MTNATQQTAAQLTERFNELSGKSIKVGSYSKMALIKMIEALETPDRPVLTDLLVNPDDYDPEQHVSLAEIVVQMGIDTKAARRKLRDKTIDDKRYTKYIFRNVAKDLNQVRAIVA